eukprot:11176977-Lingulodinium_polyedra.AAC.1
MVKNFAAAFEVPIRGWLEDCARADKEEQMLRAECSLLKCWTYLGLVERANDLQKLAIVKGEKDA